MKIVIVSTFERTGGAAVAANRLAKALAKAGAGVRMLVRDKQTNDPNTISTGDSWLMRKLDKIRFVRERLFILLYNRFSKDNLFAVSIANTGTDISKHPAIKEADIIHLHWINQGFLSLNDIKRLVNLGKPVVWTMHDMWPCTGICHHARECNNYQTLCGECFFLKHPAARDLSTRIFNKKQRIYEGNNITFVTCSAWLNGRARASALLVGHNVATIPNPLDIGIFKPSDKAACRAEYSLPLDKKLVLFGAVNVSDPRKGFAYLAEALKMCDSGTELVLAGNIKSNIDSYLPLKVNRLSFIRDENEMAKIYNAVDLYVTPSLEENLPNTIMEAMACGTPCAGFDTGGIPEMIDHKVNGYVAKYKSAEDLAEGIRWCLNPGNYNELSARAVTKARKNYAEDVVAKQYMQLYAEALTI